MSFQNAPDMDQGIVHLTRDVRPKAIPKREMVAHKLDAICAGEEASQPDEEAEDADAGDEDHPEPEEHIDLLVVEVDGQDALDGVRLDVAEVLPADLNWADHALIAGFRTPA